MEGFLLYFKSTNEIEAKTKSTMTVQELVTFCSSGLQSLSYLITTLDVPLMSCNFCQHDISFFGHVIFLFFSLMRCRVLFSFKKILL